MEKVLSWALIFKLHQLMGLTPVLLASSNSDLI